MSDHHVCPWWLAYTFDNPLRRFIHKPKNILDDYVKSGMTVMDIGCGMGYFTLAMAELVGEDGKVIAVDLQQEILNVMFNRAQKKGLARRITPLQAKADSINYSAPVDFILAFWMVHEVPYPVLFFREAAAILKSSAKLLYTEPTFHVPEKKYKAILAAALDAGLTKTKELTVRFSHAALLEKRA